MTSRPDRASLREGPLTELFRNTEVSAIDSESIVEAPLIPAEELISPDPPFRASDANNYLAVIRVVGVGGALARLCAEQRDVVVGDADAGCGVLGQGGAQLGLTLTHF